MDKKRFDHIEEDMRAASEGWQPPFDEKAWEHMEQMLDGENDRKRPIAWWMWLLPLLLITGTAAYFIINKEEDKSSVGTTQNISTDKKENNYSDNTIETKETTASLQKPVDTNISTVNDEPKKETSQTDNHNGGMRVNIIAPKTFSSAPSDDNLNDPKKNSSKQNGKMKMTVSGGMTGNDGVKEKNNELQDDEKQSSDVTITVAEPTPQQTIGKTNKPILIVVTEKEKQTDTISSEEKKVQEKQSKPSEFYFSLFAGMEGNGVNFPGLNKVSPRTGFMVGYQFTRHFSIQSGFFAGSKKYVAGKYDYKAKAGTYWAMVDIQNVDADCRVFEIPLNLRYDFNPQRKWNFSVATGLSSYIMDKEDYAYDYIRNGNPHHAQASYKGNQHFFSVWRISGGIERKLSQQFSLGLNAGLAIPLAGVGEGQIKLFSSELLLSLKYRPFKKSK